jgi:anti-anti-sigma factor
MDWKENTLNGNAVILQLNRNIQGKSFSELKNRIFELAEEKKMVIILDLKEVETLDSRGLGILVSAWVKVKEIEGEFLVAGANPYLKTILSLIKLPLEDTVEAALDKIEK